MPVAEQAMFAGIGYASGLCVGVGSSVFFGVACSLFSKQVPSRVCSPRTQFCYQPCAFCWLHRQWW